MPFIFSMVHVLLVGPLAMPCKGALRFQPAKISETRRVRAIAAATGDEH